MTDMHDVMLAMQDYISAVRDHDTQRDAYEGYSWGWAGAALIGERDRALKRLSERMEAFIDRRVDEAITRLTNGSEVSHHG